MSPFNDYLETRLRPWPFKDQPTELRERPNRTALAVAIGLPPKCLSQKMQGKSNWTQAEARDVGAFLDGDGGATATEVFRRTPALVGHRDGERKANREKKVAAACEIT